MAVIQGVVVIGEVWVRGGSQLLLIAIGTFAANGGNL